MKSIGEWTKTQYLEGKITAIEYRNPEGRSVLEIYRNYEAAFKKAGFESLFTCRDDACGPGYGGSDVYNGGWRPSGQQRHITVKGSRPEGDVYLSLHVDATYTNLTVAELEPMETGLVSVNAEFLAGEISRTGHAAIYGIYFDTGKAELKPESEPALAEIVQILHQDASLKIHVVGHTDNVGALPMNMDLSRRRAAAVVDALITRHGIAAERLHAEGIGPLAPVESNDTEQGRSKNRRVELVKQ